MLKRNSNILKKDSNMVKRHSNIVSNWLQKLRWYFGSTSTKAEMLQQHRYMKQAKQMVSEQVKTKRFSNCSAWNYHDTWFEHCTVEANRKLSLKYVHAVGDGKQTSAKSNKRIDWE